MGRGKGKPDAKSVLFKRLYGVTPETFERMEAILQKGFDKLHLQGGKPPSLTVQDKLFITLKYLREYQTMESIGAEYGVCKGTVSMAVKWVEDTLKKPPDFKLPGKKILKEETSAIQYVVVDVTESPVQRPKKTKRVVFRQEKAPYDKDAGDNKPEDTGNHRCQAEERQCA
ncbi:hypothetical protein FACS189485_22250 [Spirochaetia bacterium]|nr:hypothetical protein FACS189485_22250 [Spirochaetia bacterium]